MAKKTLVEQAMELFYLDKPKYHPVTHELMGYELPRPEELKKKVKEAKCNGLIKKRALELLPEILCKIEIKQRMEQAHDTICNDAIKRCKSD